jgi:hypothetical protein
VLSVPTDSDVAVASADVPDPGVPADAAPAGAGIRRLIWVVVSERPRDELMPTALIPARSGSSRA